MKDPVKLARKALPRYGARIVSDDAVWVLFEMPQGGRMLVKSSTHLPVVRGAIENTRDWFNPMRGYAVTAERPKASGLGISKHFTDRFDLMAEQENLTKEEIRAALTAPARVLRAGQRFAFERGRVVVICQVRDDTLCLITVLWATEDLWARNPRPERGSHG